MKILRWALLAAHHAATATKYIMYLELYDTFLLFKIKTLIYFHEISSNDRAPA